MELKVKDFMHRCENREARVRRRGVVVHRVNLHSRRCGEFTIHNIGNHLGFGKSIVGIISYYNIEMPTNSEAEAPMSSRFGSIPTFPSSLIISISYRYFVAFRIP